MSDRNNKLKKEVLYYAKLMDVLSQSEKNYMYLQLIANTHLDTTYVDDENLHDSIFLPSKTNP